MLTSGNVPRADRAIVASRYQALSSVIEANASDKITVTGVLLNPRGSLRAEQLNLILVN